MASRPVVAERLPAPHSNPLLPVGATLGFLALMVPATVVATRKIRTTASMVEAG